jgi:hypothetical protein
MEKPTRENLQTWFIRGAIFTIGSGFVVATYLFAFAYFTVSIPDPNQYVNSQATVIQYADGTEIGRVGAENRTSVQLAGVPIRVRHAIMAAEDRTFYTEHAFSPSGILRALWHNLQGGSLQGGSTITQQYAKTAFLSPQRSVKRKIKEIVIAVKLEQQLSKDQIFENYLNTIYFGRGAYGADGCTSLLRSKCLSIKCLSGGRPCQRSKRTRLLRSSKWTTIFISLEGPLALCTRWNGKSEMVGAERSRSSNLSIYSTPSLPRFTGGT